MKRLLQCILLFAGMGTLLPAVAGFINFDSAQVHPQRIFAVEIGSHRLDFLTRTSTDSMLRDAVAQYLPDRKSQVAVRKSVIRRLADVKARGFDIDLGNLIALSAYPGGSRPDPGIDTGNPRFASVPEPGTYALFGLGLLGLAYARRHVR